MQIVAALAVSLGPLAAGLGKGYSSPAIASLQELHFRNQHTNYTSFSVTDQEASWVASLSLLGALFGGMFGGLAMQYGRKRVLALMSLPFSLSWILTVFAKSVETMFITGECGVLLSKRVWWQKARSSELHDGMLGSLAVITINEV